MRDIVPDCFFCLNNPTFEGIIWRFGIDIVFLFILIRIIYFRYTKKPKFLFTFFLMGIMVFFICSMLGTVFLDMTFAFGLFAVFSILRFRTRNFSVKDMAYTFTTIGVSLINSLKVLKFPLLGTLIINIIIMVSAVMLEEFLAKHRTESHSIIYEKLGLLKPDKKEKLLEDVSLLTGKAVLKIKIRRIDYKRKTALLDIYYRD
jgi:signal transduction histidine kinase